MQCTGFKTELYFKEKRIRQCALISSHCGPIPPSLVTCTRFLRGLALPGSPLTHVMGHSLVHDAIGAMATLLMTSPTSGCHFGFVSRSNVTEGI